MILISEMVLLVRLTLMGINREALRCFGRENGKSLVQSAVISLIIMAVLIAFRLYCNAKDPANREIPLFGLYLNVHTRWLYPLSIVFQQFFIKAFTQDNIGRALRGADSAPGEAGSVQAGMTALITALFFFVLHAQYPLYYMTGGDCWPWR